MGKGGGGGKMKFPTQHDILELRYPEQVQMDADLRDYFRSVLESPNMGFTKRTTYNPIDLYAASIESRPFLVNSINMGGFGSGAPMADGSTGQRGSPTPNIPAEASSPLENFWGKTAFGRLQPNASTLPPAWPTERFKTPSIYMNPDNVWHQYQATQGFGPKTTGDDLARMIIKQWEAKHPGETPPAPSPTR